MSMCRAPLRNTSNALTLRMSSEQIRLQVSPTLFNWGQQHNPADDQAVNFRPPGPVTENARVPEVLCTLLVVTAVSQLNKSI